MGMLHLPKLVSAVGLSRLTRYASWVWAQVLCCPLRIESSTRLMENRCLRTYLGWNWWQNLYFIGRGESNVDRIRIKNHVVNDFKSRVWTSFDHYPWYDDFRSAPLKVELMLCERSSQEHFHPCTGILVRGTIGTEGRLSRTQSSRETTVSRYPNLPSHNLRQQVNPCLRACLHLNYVCECVGQVDPGDGCAQMLIEIKATRHTNPWMLQVESARKFSHLVNIYMHTSARQNSTKWQSEEM